MYFLPKYNLLENVENIEEMKKISVKVGELSKDIPAIITAISSVANTKLCNVIFTDLFRTLSRNDKSMFEDDKFWKNSFQELNQFEIKLPAEFELPKEMTAYTAFINNIFENILSINPNLFL